jgi:tetratricopeptide (TPR) repeat protein
MVRPVHDLAKVREITTSAADAVAQPEGQVYFENGVLFLQNGLVDRAKDQLRKSFSIDPRFRGTLLHLTNDLGSKRAFDTAIFLYEMLLELSPEYVPARENLAVTFLNRGVVHARNGLLPGAIDDFNRALMLNPSGNTVEVIRKNIVASYTQLGVLHSDAKEYELAFRWFQLALEIDPSELSRNNLAVSMIAVSTAQADNRAGKQIDQIFRQPILMGLGLSQCWTAYGATVAGLGDAAEAARAFRAALDSDPKNEVARHDLDALSAQGANQEISAGLICAEIKPLSLSA